jgi:hypothetical protein
VTPTYGRQNELIYGLFGFTGVLRIHLEFYGSLRSLRVFLGVASALPAATGDAIPLPVRWLYLLYCLDDRAHRRHIYLIPPQYENIYSVDILTDTSPRPIKTRLLCTIKDVVDIKDVVHIADISSVKVSSRKDGDRVVCRLQRPRLRLRLVFTEKNWFSCFCRLLLSLKEAIALGGAAGRRADAFLVDFRTRLADIGGGGGEFAQVWGGSSGRQGGGSKVPGSCCQ